MSRKHSNKSKSPIIDLVVTTAGRFDLLSKCLDSIYREAQSHPIGLYIVDDFSPAEEWISNRHLFEYQKDKDPAGNVVVFRTKRHTTSEGFPRTANDGAREGKSPLIMFISDDVELHKGALDKVIRRFDDLTIGVVGIKLIFPPDSTSPIRPAGKVQHVGLALNIRSEPIHPLVGWNPDNPLCCVSREAWAVTGACISVRRNLFNKVGGFDTGFGKGTFEDVSLCLSVRQLGSKIFIDTSATAYHYVGATVEKKREAFPLQMNFMQFQAKWAQSGLLVWDEFTYYDPIPISISGNPDG